MNTTWSPTRPNSFIEDGTYLIVNASPERRNHVILADDGSLAAGWKWEDGEPTLDSLWDVQRLDNNRYTIRSTASHEYASELPNINGCAVVTQAKEEDWMILETRVKGRFVIGHVRTLHYWGLDSDDIGVPTMLRPNAASRGNTWVFKKYEGALPNQYSATTDPLLRHLDIMNRKRPKPPTILRNEENDVGEGARSVVVTPQEDSPSVIWDNPNDGDPQFLIPNCGVFIPAMTYFKYLEANDDDKLDCNWKREYPTLMAARIQAYPYLRRRDGLGDIGLPTDPGSGLNIPIAEIDPCAVQGACNVVQRYPMTEKLTETFIGAVNLLCLFIYVAGYIMRHGWMI